MVNPEHIIQHETQETFPELEVVKRVLTEPHPLTGSVNSRKWRTSLCAATDVVDVEKDYKKAVQLLPFWLDYLKSRAIYGLSTSQGIEALGYFLHMVRQNDLLGTITSSSEHSQIFAWACLTKLEAVGNNMNQHKKADVVDLLNIWSSKKSINKDMTVAQAADLIYGPGAWDLYRSDVEESYALPGYLLSLGLPLRIAPLTQEHGCVNTALPRDIV